MPYPTIDKPYGFKPANLLGSQVFAGATRMLPIAYSYATNIFYGDFVNLSRGQVQRLSVTTGGATNWGGTITAAAGTSTSTGAGALLANFGSLVGVFLGCTFTNPVTKQKQFSQYWPANTLAGDAMAYIADDPDTAFRAAVVTTQGGTTIGSVAPAMVGQNLTASDLAGSTATGNSSNALLYTAITQSVAGEFTASAYPFRVVDVVRDTAVTLGTATYSSGTSTITTTANVGFAVPVGTQLAWLTSAGVLVDTGSFVATAISANSTTSVVLSNAPLTTPSASATLVFIQYPEAIVKYNMGAHGYYTSYSVV